MSAALLSMTFALMLCGVHSSKTNVTLRPIAVMDGPWSLRQEGTTGVSGLELAIVSETTALIYDKVEHNPLQVNGHLAWAAEYDLTTNTPRALNPLSNSWCAGGAHLSNGTFVSTGGNPIVIPGAGDLNGLQALRLFDGCEDKSCDVFEDPQRVRLASNRWYPSASRLDDGSIMIFGGSTAGGFINSAEVNNPTYEFYPPKNIHGRNGLPIDNKFLRETLNANQFPIVFLLPSGSHFVAANTEAMLFNWRTNVETRLPSIPNGIHVISPFTAASALLPLMPPDYTPAVLICGGSNVSDTVSPNTLSSQTPASTQCVRITLDDAGIRKGWEVENMPQPRLMGEAILLPDGRVLIVNGAKTGVASYGNVVDQVGQSNADNPNTQPILYDPAAPAGSRFSTDGIPTSPIPRMYHSVASLTPNGTILLAGSNPNVDVSTITYPTEYRVEHLVPAYLSDPKLRPVYEGLPDKIDYGAEFQLRITTLPTGVANVSVSLVDLGFATHGVHMDQRLVHLTSRLSSSRTSLTITAPPSANVFPPGPAYLYIVTDAGVPSFGKRLLIGRGQDPPIDQGAIDNLLANTPSSQRAQSLSMPSQGEGSKLPSNPFPASP